MSIHIEHGYRVTGANSVAALNALILAFQQQVEGAARTLYRRKRAALAYQILDESVLQSTREAFLEAVRREYATAPQDRSRPFADTHLRWVVPDIIADHQALVARTQERDPAYDWGCHLSAIPHRTGLYVLLYTENEEYRTIWQAVPGVQNYAYWNHTDPPEGMTRARWERRRQRWTELGLLSIPGIPSRVGMTIDIYDPLIDWENRFWQIEPEYIPDYERRIQHWAFTRAVEEVWHTKPPEERGFQTVFRTQRWIKTEDGAKRLDALKQAIRTVLPMTWNDALIHQSLDDIWEASATLRMKHAE